MSRSLHTLVCLALIGLGAVAPASIAVNMASVFGVLVQYRRLLFGHFSPVWEAIALFVRKLILVDGRKSDARPHKVRTLVLWVNVWTGHDHC